MVGDGPVEPVASQSPGNAVDIVRDYGLEHAPTIVAAITAIFLVGLLFYLVRRGLAKSRSAMRL